jgi:ubiquitin-protein ligase
MNYFQRRFLKHQLIRGSLPAFDSNEISISWNGLITSNNNNEYLVKIQYPTNFPSEPPSAFIVSPQVDDATPHRWVKKNNALCLMHPNDHTWERNSTAATFIALVAAWIFAYESWKETGEWIGKEFKK